MNLTEVPTPCYVIDLQKLKSNLQILKRVQDKSGAKVLLALKAFSMHALAPVVMEYLKGVCASGLNEARLGRQEFKGEVHSYSAAFIPEDFDEILCSSDHIIFNSFSQWNTYKARCVDAKKKSPHKSFGLRINPEHSESKTELYDPCAPCSRMGIKYLDFEGQDLAHIEGLHFHTLCEQGVEPLRRTLDIIEQNFAHILPTLKWVNFGGGHHITDASYDIDALIQILQQFTKKYDVQIYLEPGEAVALNAGVLVTQVLDIIHNDINIAILDTSATCHMPDVIEMPYRPRLSQESSSSNAMSYRLAGPSCLAGDIIGDYNFDRPLKVHDRLTFEDMAIYTMVKNTTFNGINLPSIAVWDRLEQSLSVIKKFGYNDFKQRLS